MKTRLLYIDRLKGMAILFVVMGHIIMMSGLYDEYPIRFIYAFNMPLFFWILAATLSIIVSGICIACEKILRTQPLISKILFGR